MSPEEWLAKQPQNSPSVSPEEWLAAQSPAPKKSAKTFGERAFELAEEPVAVGGGMLGAVAGAPLGPLGGAAGAGLGYAGTKEALRSARMALGYPVEKRSVAQQVTQPLKNVATGATFEAGGQVLGKALEPALTKVSKPLGAAAQKVRDVFSTPEVTPVGSSKGFVDLGEQISKRVSGAGKKRFEARSQEAKNLYEDARAAARETQKEVPFSESEPGQRLISELEREKGFTTQTPEGKKEFTAGKAKIKGIDELLAALKPEVTGGKAELKGLARYERTPVRTTYKDVDAVVEELRRIREVDKPGAEQTGYSALDATYRKNLEERLSNALYEWSEQYRVADEAYKAASQRLRPFQTKLMQRLLSKEKYSPEELATDTEQFVKQFYKSRDTVRELKTAIGDDMFVFDMGADYFATLMENQTPAQVRAFVNNPNNQGWLQESGVLGAAQRYANQTTRVESAKNIRSALLRYGATAAVGYEAARLLGRL